MIHHVWLAYVSAFSIGNPWPNLSALVHTGLPVFPARCTTGFTSAGENIKSGRTVKQTLIKRWSIPAMHVHGNS